MKLKLGKMEPDYCGYPGTTSSEDKDRKMAERFPTVYINNDELPELKPGDKVVLYGEVTEFGDRKRKTKEGGESEIETFRNCEVDIKSMEVSASQMPTPKQEDDEAVISKGLDEASESEDEDE